ncbi:MAG: hypothetical protein ACI8PP_002862, partial [Candidatus Pseudothioglobus sp.]
LSKTVIKPRISRENFRTKKRIAVLAANTHRHDLQTGIRVSTSLLFLRSLNHPNYFT